MQLEKSSLERLVFLNIKLSEIYFFDLELKCLLHIQCRPTSRSLVGARNNAATRPS